MAQALVKHFNLTHTQVSSIHRFQPVDTDMSRQVLSLQYPRISKVSECTDILRELESKKVINLAEGILPVDEPTLDTGSFGSHSQTIILGVSAQMSVDENIALIQKHPDWINLLRAQKDGILLHANAPMRSRIPSFVDEKFVETMLDWCCVNKILVVSFWAVNHTISSMDIFERMIRGGVKFLHISNSTTFNINKFLALLIYVAKNSQMRMNKIRITDIPHWPNLSSYINAVLMDQELGHALRQYNFMSDHTEPPKKNTIHVDSQPVDHQQAFLSEIASLKKMINMYDHATPMDVTIASYPVTTRHVSQRQRKIERKMRAQASGELAA